MREYYCYVYYDENWIAYYVGKGSKRRSDYRNDLIPVPTPDKIQRFTFSYEWQAYECEVQLVSLWGRKLDGGTLVNQTFGGPGIRGLARSNSYKANASALRKAHPKLKEIIEKCVEATRTPVSLVNVITNEVADFPSVQEAARCLGLNASHISALRSKKRKTHKGWRLTNA